MALTPAPRPDRRDRRLRAMRAHCEARGLDLTEPRDVILRALLEAGGHPTADEVYAAAMRLEEGVGRATVYRALESFVKIGLLTKASHTGSAVRYDAVVERHHHLVCLRCDRIIDVADESLDQLPIPDATAMGFVVQDVQVQLRGICGACAEKEESP